MLKENLSEVGSDSPNSSDGEPQACGQEIITS